MKERRVTEEDVASALNLEARPPRQAPAWAYDQMWLRFAGRGERVRRGRQCVAAQTMNYAYDTEADALYIRVTNGAVDQQLELDDGLFVDLASDGSLVGIDVVSASSPWASNSIFSRFYLAEPDRELLSRLADTRWGERTQYASEPNPPARETVEVLPSHAA